MDSPVRIPSLRNKGKTPHTAFHPVHTNQPDYFADVPSTDHHFEWLKARHATFPIHNPIILRDRKYTPAKHTPLGVDKDKLFPCPVSRFVMILFLGEVLDGT